MNHDVFVSSRMKMTKQVNSINNKNNNNNRHELTIFACQKAKFLYLFMRTKMCKSSTSIDILLIIIYIIFNHTIPCHIIPQYKFRKVLIYN